LGWGLGVVRHRFRCLLAAEIGPAAVGGGYSGELLLGLSNKRLEGLQRVLGELLERLDSWEHTRAQGLGVDGHGGAARLGQQRNMRGRRASAPYIGAYWKAVRARQ
jgi:hypothetical protein